MPRVSVLLTCYNHLEYIEECVKSVEAQTFTDWEIIAIDDGSKDGTREWIRDYPLDMVRIFNEKNLGTYGTLNRALEASSGEFIAILNDDDVWLPRKLELQVAAMDSDPKLGLVHTFGKFVGADTQELDDPEPLGFPFPRSGNGDQFASLIYHNKVINSAALFRRKCIDTAGLWDPAFYGCGDWHMWLRIARDWHVRYLEEPLTLYRVHETNACRDTKRMDDDSLRIREWIYDWAKEVPQDRPGLREALAINFAALGTERMWRGNRSGAIRACLDSLRMKPLRAKTYLRLLATLLPQGVYRKLN